MNLYDSEKKNLKALIEKFQTRIEYLSGKSNKFSYYRLTAFLTGTALTVTGFYLNNIAGWIILILSLFAFGLTVHMHNVLLMRIKRFYAFLKIKKQHFARMTLDWDNIPNPDLNYRPEENSMAKDLDLTGYRSLHHLTDISVSNEGCELLNKMFLNTSPEYDVIMNNQRIISELKVNTSFRDKFLLKAELISGKKLDSGKILKWFENTSENNLPKWLFPVSVILIIAYISLFVFSFYENGSSAWFGVFLVYFILYSSFQKQISKTFEETTELDRHIRKFSSLIFLIEKTNFKGCKNTLSFIHIFKNKNSGASEKLKSLQKIISLILIRENPVFRLIINFVFPFDVLLFKRLKILRTEIKDNIKNWLDRMNELECYISLANYACLNPDYEFPEIVKTGEGIFETKLAGHPLIPRENKVCNDFRLMKENEIILITGSNMSGKSTVLKTLGINLCLAYAGAPVNAGNFKTSLYELFTCIKVSDSVADGISYFYAEVKKLKELLDEFKNEKHLMMFYLIDEIFKGTNNRERLEGSRAYIKELSRQKGTGAVTTHDLELVNLANEVSSVTNYHFREEIEDSKMKFDFKIHDGPSPTTNALKIMELSGLPVR